MQSSVNDCEEKLRQCCLCCVSDSMFTLLYSSISKLLWPPNPPAEMKRSFLTELITGC